MRINWFDDFDVRKNMDLTEKSVKKVKKYYDKILEEIQETIPNFNGEKFLDSTKLKLMTLYRALKSGEYTFIDNLCEDELLYRIKNEKYFPFDMSEDIDFFSAQSRKFHEYRRGVSYDEIDIMISGFYVDYMKNNKLNYDPSKKRYFETSLIVTFRAPCFQNNDDDYKCENCGARMIKREGRMFYVCEYCGNNKVADYGEWKISNIVEMN